jgi:hypothetical protein
MKCPMNQVPLFSGLVIFLVLLSSLASASSLPKGEEYKSLYGDVIRIVSSTEVETIQHDTNIVGTYSVDNNVVRMVFEFLGTKMSTYFDVVGDGLKERGTGKIYYSSKKYAAAKKKYDEDKKKKELEAKAEFERKAKEDAIAREKAARETQERQAREEKEARERRAREELEAMERHAKEQRNRALIEATLKCDAEKTKSILEQGVDLNTQDYNWRTPLMIASRDGCLEIVKLLIQYKVDINYRNNWGMTALDWAKREKRSAIMNLLLENGAK